MMTPRTRCSCALRLTAIVAVTVTAPLAFMTACHSPLDEPDWDSIAGRLGPIQSTPMGDFQSAPPVDLETVFRAIDTERSLVTPEDLGADAAPGRAIPISIEEARAAALAGNLDLAVQLINPEVAALQISEEEARFEATLTGSLRYSDTDAPVALGTEGSQGNNTSASVGLNVPLRTGGTFSIDVPLNRSETNNPFALLNPAYDAALRFSLSHELLRGAGADANLAGIRIARLQEGITIAETRLEAIRILADVDRAYWLLFAAERDLEVARDQYDLAVAQEQRARRRVDAGAVAPIEVLRARSGVAQRVDRLVTAAAAVNRTTRNLKRIMQRDDLPLTGTSGITLATSPQPVRLQLDPVRVTEFAIANRMEMLTLELQLAVDARTIDLRKDEKLPRLTLDYVYGLNGLGPNIGDAFEPIPESDFANWSVGVNGSIPLGNEAARSRLDQAILGRIQRLATRDQRTAAIRQEVLDSLNRLEEAWQRIIAARQEAVLAGATYEAELRQFEVGARTSTDVLDASATLADAQRSEIASLTEYEIAQVDLAFATGTLLGRSRTDWMPADSARERFDERDEPGP